MLNKEKSEHYNNDFDLSKIVYRIINMSTGDISNYTFVTDIVDNQFNRTFSFLIFNAIVYIGLFAAPVIIIIFASESM